jgi:hypothetical protein
MQHNGDDSLETTRNFAAPRGAARFTNIGIFTGNAPGSKLPFATFKDNFRRKATNEGSETSKKILFGEFDIDVKTAQDMDNRSALDTIHNDLIVWPGHREPRDLYEWTDDDDYYYTLNGINHLDILTQRIATVHYNELLASTAGEARDEVLLHEREDDPIKRLKLTWKAMNTRFDDYPEYIILEITQRLENLQVYTVKKAEGDSAGVYRAWNPSDAMETYFVKLEALRADYLRIIGNPDTEPTEAAWTEIIKKITRAVNPYFSYEVATSRFDSLTTDEQTWPRYKTMLIERAKKIAYNNSIINARRPGTGVCYDFLHTEHAS